MKSLAKKLARLILGDYSFYHIYARSADATGLPQLRAPLGLHVRTVDEAVLRSYSDTTIREQAGYAGSGSHAYVAYDGDRIVGVCFYWFGDRYRMRNFWTLADREAKLVQIWVHPDARGRGIAPRLIADSFEDMVENGYGRAYARIWHSNTPSLRAFERAGWSRVARVVEINPFRRKRPIRIRLGSGA